jgi:hypothetical protein
LQTPCNVGKKNKNSTVSDREIDSNLTLMLLNSLGRAATSQASQVFVWKIIHHLVMPKEGILPQLSITLRPNANIYDDQR